MSMKVYKGNLGLAFTLQSPFMTMKLALVYDLFKIIYSTTSCNYNLSGVRR